MPFESDGSYTVTRIAKTIDPSVERLVFVSDLHAFTEPLDAIDAILKDYPEKSAILVCGDIIYSGPNPVETLEWTQARAGELAILGNHDELLLHLPPDASQPPITEPGARALLDDALMKYIGSLPDEIDLHWRGKKINIMHGHRDRSGNSVCWTTTPRNMLKIFADNETDLTVTGHTHYPFLRQGPGGMVANCGSTSLTLWGYTVLPGHTKPDGVIHPQGDEKEFSPLPKPFCSFLTVTLAEGQLSPEIVRFDYDRASALEKLKLVAKPDFEAKKSWIETGVY